MEKPFAYLALALALAARFRPAVLAAATPSSQACSSPGIADFEDGWEGYFQESTSYSFSIWNRIWASSSYQLRDHTTGTGHYLKLSGYSINKPGLRSPIFINIKPSRACSVSFWYSGYRSYNRAAVTASFVIVNWTDAVISKHSFFSTNISSSSLWSNSKAYMIPSTATRFYILIEGSTSHYGAVRIDDITFTSSCCFKSLPVISDVQLTPVASSLYPWDGLLTVLHNGLRGTVCSRYYSSQTALGNVTCLELGFPGVKTTSTASSVPSEVSHSPVWFSRIDCIGTEKAVADCKLVALTTNSTSSSCRGHQYDLLIHCNPLPNSNFGLLRLVNPRNSNPYGGRVELYTRYGWLSICDNGWSLISAGVVCRQLGYGPVEGAMANAYFGAGNSSILSAVSCNGYEERLIDCTDTILSQEKCDHNEDAGVICSAPVNRPPEVCTAASSFTDGLGDYTSSAQRSYYGWLSSTGLHYPYSYFPKRSYTERNSDGHFVYFYNGYHLQEVKSSLVSPLLIPPHPSAGNCTLSFYFFSNGHSSSNVAQGPLVVNVLQATGSDVVYISDTKLSHHWRHVSVPLAVSGVFQVQFTARISGSQSLVVAIDQVSFSANCCSNFKNTSLNFTTLFQPTHTHRACGVIEFENGLGDFTSSSSSGDSFVNWQTASNYARKGSYADVEVYTFVGIPIDVYLSSPLYTTTALPNDCQMTFWYHISVPSYRSSVATQLQVLTSQPGVQNRTVFTVKYSWYNHPRSWLSATVNLNLVKAKPFKVIFKATLGGQYAGVGIDSISLSSACCTNSSAAPLRLVNGMSATDGRLEVFHDDVWGSVCDDQWDWKDAIVACQQMGFLLQDMTVVAVPGARAMGKIWMDEVSCSGFEAALEDCAFVGWGGTDCTHDEDVYLRCVFKNTTELYRGKLRLIGGLSSNAGQVQIYRNGEWQPICRRSISTSLSASSPAHIMCHQLGFEGASSFGYQSQQIGSQTGYIDVVTSIKCSGQERQLSQCALETHYHYSCSSHGYYLYVTCGTPATGINTSMEFPSFTLHPTTGTPFQKPVTTHDQFQGKLKLVGGSSRNTGQVWIYQNSEWEPICRGSISTSLSASSPAHIMCHQLGFEGASSISYEPWQSGFQVRYNQVVTSIQCSGQEKQLSQCALETHYHYSCSSHGYYLYMTCGKPATGISTKPWQTTTLPYRKPVTSQLQVVIHEDASMRPGKGVVYFLYNGEWLQVASLPNYYFTLYIDDFANAEVICRQLGYNGVHDTSEYREPHSYYRSSQQEKRIVLRCLGDEQNLSQCIHGNLIYYGNSLAVDCMMSTDRGSVLPFGAMLGIVLGSVAFVLLLASEIHRRRHRSSRSHTTESNTTQTCANLPSANNPPDMHVVYFSASDQSVHVGTSSEQMNIGNQQAPDDCDEDTNDATCLLQDP